MAVRAMMLDTGTGDDHAMLGDEEQGTCQVSSTRVDAEYPNRSPDSEPEPEPEPEPKPKPKPKPKPNANLVDGPGGVVEAHISPHISLHLPTSPCNLVDGPGGVVEVRELVGRRVEVEAVEVKG